MTAKKRFLGGVAAFSADRDELCDAFKAFVVLTGREPVVVRVPPAAETAWRDPALEMLGEHRTEPTLFGCRVVWDAPVFKLE